MSGPKVVHIVTRGEIIALCEGLLAQLDAALAEWTAVAERTDTLTGTDVAAMGARRDEIRRLLAEDRFIELQKAVPAEIAYLASDRSERLVRAVEVKARARTTRRQAAAVAKSVLGALDRSAVAASSELRHDLEEAASGRIDGAAAIRRAFDLLATKEAPAISDEQRRLAAALKDGDDHLSVSEWLASQPPSGDDERFARLDRKLAELAVTLGDSATAAFEDRLRSVSSEPPSDRRALLVDSLEVDLAQAVAKARDLAALRARVRMLAAELIQTGSPECAAVARSIEVEIDGPGENLARLEEEGKGVLERVRNAAAAESRRRAVLEGLAQIGYEVTEGMQTAWARDGRVIVKRAAQTGYAVELAGSADSPRVQMRTVALRSATAPVDTTRDRDAETIWCGDLATLRAAFAAAGGSIIIEQARAVGAVPLRTVEDASDVAQAAARKMEPPAPRQRRVD